MAVADSKRGGAVGRPPPYWLNFLPKAACFRVKGL